MIKVKEFFLEESTKNKKCMVLVAVDENGKKWVVAGDYYYCTHVIEYERCFSVQKEKEREE